MRFKLLPFGSIRTSLCLFDRHKFEAYYLRLTMNPSPKRILVVSDDAMLRSTRVSILERSGYSGVSAATDDDAMKLLEAEHFDLVLIGRRSEIPRLELETTIEREVSDVAGTQDSTNWRHNQRLSFSDDGCIARTCY
jgi:hypothetical protein